MRRLLLLLVLLAWPLGAAEAFRLQSSAFQEGQTIPLEHTGKGQDLSPPLRWTSPPKGTVELALVCLDPDAPGGVFVHWVLAGLPADLRELKAGEKGYVQGHNDFGGSGYRGPNPPPGKAHHYHFRLLALDKPLQASSGITWKQLEQASQGHVLGQAELMGLFAR